MGVCMFTYRILHDPVPLARARWNGRRVYDPQMHLKIQLQHDIAVQHGKRPQYTGPLYVDCTFFMPMPQRMQDNSIGKPHIYKPDLDNLVKLLFDVASRILFKDDCSICQLTCRKIYDRNPRTEFTVHEQDKEK
jgi:Holliday junction resolvase RusA-like endonuclease